MKETTHTTANRAKLPRVNEAFETMVHEVLRYGFHGVARLELVIADGTIQRIHRAVEHIEK